MSASKNVPRIVPWLSGEDWRSTRQLLYSADVAEVERGLMQAKVWLDRGKVPTAVESTINFLEIILSDRVYLNQFMRLRLRNSDLESSDDIEIIDDTEVVYDDRQLRLAYSSAVIRFVNELVDRAQKSLFATSITKLADQIGLPRVFVDIRHDGTHDRLSSLELLRWAAGQAVAWLEDHYWSFEDDDSDASNVFALLDGYCEQVEKINEAQTAFALEKSSMARIINQIDFLQTLPRVMREFLSCLCEFQRQRGVYGVSTENASEKNNLVVLVVIESLVRPLVRMSGDIFFSALAQIVLDRRETDSWFPWIIAEAFKCGANVDNFVAEVFETFAGKSSEALFKSRIIVIWEHFGAVVRNEKTKRVFGVFERVYSQKSSSKKSSDSSIKKSRAFLAKRKYLEYEELDGWSEVCENWRPCPLGSTPHEKIK